MNLKQISFGAVAVVATVATVIASATPARAFNLSFTGAARFDDGDNPLASTATFDFGRVVDHDNNTATAKILDWSRNEAEVQPTTDSFLANLGDILTLTDLTLNRVDATNWSLAASTDWIIDGFITDGQVFTLTQFDFNTDSKRALISGFFNPPGQVSGGDLTTQSQFILTANGTSYSVQLVPAPALIPSLIGVGAAALRKRKKQEAEEAELAEAKA